jgi:hypothetical protein
LQEHTENHADGPTNWWTLPATSKPTTSRDAYDALGVTRQSAWESFTADVRAALEANVDANSALTEDDAVDLAVDEVRAVRRRATR